MRGAGSVQALMYALIATPHRNAETRLEDPPSLALGARLTKASVAAAAENQIAKMMKFSLFLPEIVFDTEYKSNAAKVRVALAARCVKSL